MIKNPLINYTEILQNLCWQASKEKRPALWLYEEEGRAQFFMLEALCRLFYFGLEIKSFMPWHNIFKEYEDLMGAINCYEMLLERFKGNASISIDVITFWANTRTKYLKKFTQKFKKDGYLLPQLLKFKEMIKVNQIQFDQKTVSLIGKAIKKELNKISKDVSTINFKFTDIENHIHELWRRTRWLEMYSQSLNGIIIQKNDTTKFEWEKRYITGAVRYNPYLKLIHNQTFEKHILLNKKHFMAFMGLNAHLGEFKEAGLRNEMLAFAIAKTENVTKEKAILKANKIIKSEMTNETILLKASNIAKDFFEINNIPNGLFANKM